MAPARSAFPYLNRHARLVPGIHVLGQFSKDVDGRDI
jgi:hypothetical protein